MNVKPIILIGKEGLEISLVNLNFSPVLTPHIHIISKSCQLQPLRYT